MADRQQRVRQVFGQASELTEAERAAYLDEACADDALLRHEVEALLADFDEAGDFLEVPFHRLTQARRLGTDVGLQLGDYRLIRPLGGGGMGHVYLAERVDDEFRQQVAVKLLRSEQRETLARFKLSTTV